MTTVKIILICSTVSAMPAINSFAEPKTPKEQEPRLCLDGHAPPRCDAVPLIEAGVRMDLAEERLPWTLSAGFLFNVAPSSGVGFTADLRLGDLFPRWALRARYRHWISPSIGLDFAAGPIFAKDGLSEEFGDYGATTGLALDLGGYIALTGDIDIFNAGEGRELSATFGIRFGAGVVLRLIGVSLFQAAKSKPRRPRWIGGE